MISLLALDGIRCSMIIEYASLSEFCASRLWSPSRAVYDRGFILRLFSILVGLHELRSPFAPVRFNDTVMGHPARFRFGVPELATDVSREAKGRGR